ncbi:MAG: acyltransferase, partial [Actinobacteria bacterium]|nr:acyltransferase [Actinomycetota bacterium]MCG2807521.1 acyltransferase [Coriobacteriia bacterium]
MTTAAQSSTSPKSSRVPEYDVARVVSIALVILIHVIAPYVAPETRELGRTGVIGLMSRDLRFAVPMFVMLTGALLWSRPLGGAPSWREFFSRRLTLVLVPYFVWSAIFLALGARLGIKPLGSAGMIVRDLMLGTTWYHLYFVPIIVGIYFCTPAAYALFHRSVPALLIVATAIGVVVPIALSRLDLHPAAPFKLVSLVALFLPYAAVGAWYANERASGSRLIARTWPALLIAGLALRAW